MGAWNCLLGAWNCLLGAWTCLLGALLHVLLAMVCFPMGSGSKASDNCFIGNYASGQLGHEEPDSGRAREGSAGNRQSSRIFMTRCIPGLYGVIEAALLCGPW